MKKIFALIISVILCFSVCSTAFASEYKVALTPSKNTFKAGESITLTVSISGDMKVDSAAIYVNLTDGLSVKSGEITKSAQIKSFDLSTNKGVAAFNGTVDFKGEFAKLEIAAGSSAKGTQTVTVGVIANPGKVTVENKISFDFSDKSSSSSSKSSSNSSTGSKGEGGSSKASSSSSEKTESSGVSNNTSGGNDGSLSEPQITDGEGKETSGEILIADKITDNTNTSTNTNKMIIIFSCIAAVVIIATVATVLLTKKKR